MKLRSISNARRVAWHSDFGNLPRRATVAPNTQKEHPSDTARRAGPERKKYSENWTKPANLLEAAKVIAKVAIAFHRRRWSMIKNVDALDLAEEAASSALADYFSLSDFDRPQSEDDFGKWVYWRCIDYLAKRAKELVRDHSGEKPESEVPDDYREWMKRSEHSYAETRLMAWDAVRAIDQLPPEMKRMAYKMAAGANVLEASEEMDMPVVEAITMQRALRRLAQWLSDDEADERLAAANVGTLGDHAIRRAKERHGLDMSRADFIEIAAAIRAGRATLVADDGPLVKIYRVPFAGRMLPCAYNPVSNIVLSVLPESISQERANKVVHPLSPDAVLIPREVTLTSSQVR